MSNTTLRSTVPCCANLAVLRTTSHTWSNNLEYRINAELADLCQGSRSKSRRRRTRHGLHSEIGTPGRCTAIAHCSRAIAAMRTDEDLLDIEPESPKTSVRGRAGGPGPCSAATTARAAQSAGREYIDATLLLRPLNLPHAAGL